MARDYRVERSPVARACPELADTVEENEHFLVNRELRDIELTKSDMAWVNG